MSAPPPAVTALVWAVVGPPLLVYAATRVRNGQRRLHAGLMIAWIVIELLVFLGFSVFVTPSSRREALEALPIFKIHLAFAISTFAGIAFQVTSRMVARLRSAHRLAGPYVVLVWCLALVTGIYNYVFLYVFNAG